MKTASQVVDALLAHWDLSSDAELARKINVDPNSILQMRKRTTTDKQTNMIIALLNEQQQSAHIKQRYKYLLRNGVVKLSINEWLTMFDAMSSTDTNVAPKMALSSLWANVLDSAVDGIGEKHGIDCGMLSAFIRGSTPSQQLFMLDVVERLWFSSDTIHDISSWLEEQGVLLVNLDSPNE